MSFHLGKWLNFPIRTGPGESSPGEFPLFARFYERLSWFLVPLRAPLSFIFLFPFSLELKPYLLASGWVGKSTYYYQ